MNKVLEVIEVKRGDRVAFFEIIHQDFAIFPRGHYEKTFDVNGYSVCIASRNTPEYDNMSRIFICGDVDDCDHYTLEVPLNCLSFFLDTIEVVNESYGYTPQLCGI